MLRKKIVCKGLVQGIGFRPYLYLMAKKKNLRGFVLNNDEGVLIEIEGREEKVNEFIDDLHNHPPPLAQICSLDVSEIPSRKDTEFVIRESREGYESGVHITPDLAICPQCREELNDPHDRRYRYPFISCTQCGPRLTIIKKLPYDRHNTSMVSFPFCPECEEEFNDPGSRRFHAQTNACPVCGPRVWLADSNGSVLETACDPIKKAAQLIREGAIIAIKGLGGFHLAVDATNDQAVSRLRKRKAREEKPFALMSESIDKIRKYAEVSEYDITILTSIAHPIVLLDKKKAHHIAPSVAPGQRYFGVMLPYTPLHVILLHNDFLALVMTSANISEEPIVTRNDEAGETLAGIADYYLFNDRDILIRCDDSVVMPMKGKTRLIRRSRGYAPLPLLLPRSYPPVLALGGELKNTLCVVTEKKAFLSQHIGDLSTPAAREFFSQSIERIQEIAGAAPDIVAYDLHPDYFSTRLAQDMTEKTCYPVQHHHAHLVSCLADNALAGKVIGVIYDGTGYGPDGTIWGGELLIGDEYSFERAAHLSHFPLPGGEAAIREPSRIAMGMLYQVYGQKWEHYAEEFFGTVVTHEKKRILKEVLCKKINTPLTSSMGRLFDGVSALLGFHKKVSYEGQAAIRLEQCASLSNDQGIYPISLHQEKLPYVMEIAPVIQGIINDIHDDISLEVISRRFHNTVIRMTEEAVLSISRRFSLQRIVMSGGCFQNRILCEGLMEQLTYKGMSVFIHQHVPTNDGGISLGQAVCAASVHSTKETPLLSLAAQP
ncbi:MAG: carbamoyltransferase HypF [bacterium]